MKVISKHEGHFHGNIEKNPYNILEDEKGKYVEMFTDKGSFIFDYSDIDLVKYYKKGETLKYITWHFKLETRVKNRISHYVRGTIDNKKIYLHQWIMKYYGYGHIGITIDHIDRNPLNNRRYNLRLATKTVQNSNTHKRVRGTNGCDLPEEIKNIILPKYVSYTKFKKTTKLGYRDGFIIQCHPSQKKEYKEKLKWLTTMSMNININEKLNEALEKLKQLNLKYNKQQNQIAGKSLES